MISSILSNGDEIEINNAYANIGLIASRVWAYNQEDPYRKLNQSLWIQYCKLSEEHEGNNGTTRRTVRDVIPTSRLAQYGDYEYNEEREKMYKSLEETQGAWLDQREPQEARSNGDGTTIEPWMLEQVEEYFLKHISPNYRFSQYPIKENINGTEGNKSFHQDEDFRKFSIPYAIDDNEELQLQERISSKIVKDLWITRSGLSGRNQRSKIHEEKMKHFRHSSEKRLETRKYYSQSSSCSLRTDQGLILRGQSLYSEKNAPIRKPVFPVLSAEVPEFFPKSPATGTENRRTPVQFFPSSTERSYQDELFPYNRGHLTNSSTIPQNTSAVPITFSHPTVNTLIRAPHQWIQRLGPPIQIQVPGICSAGHPPLYSSIQPIYPAAIIHRPINLHEKILTATAAASSSSSAASAAGPAPIPVYQRPAELYQEASQRRGKNHQGVDFNNLILLTKNAMKARRNQSKNPQQASSFILESRQPNLKSETDVLQWLDKGYPKRAREFVTVNSLVSELSNFEAKCDFDASISTTRCKEVRTSLVTSENDNLEYNVTDDSDVPIAKKRLYRDVLTNATSTEIILDNVLDSRYDELEQQAMEQYRTSEECLALRYQELERQALEQYKNGSSSSESIRSIRSSTICGRKDNEENENGDKGNEFMGNGRRCSGFDKNSSGGSSVDIFSSGRVKGPPEERQVVILRPDNRYGSVASARESTVENSNVTRGTAIITKSLTALNHAAFEGVSGNKIKGASGDNTEDRAKSSQNGRNLLLVSPVKRSIPISASSISSASGSSSRYRKPMKDEGISSGGGDEKVTILNAPGAQVWLSSFWG